MIGLTRFLTSRRSRRTLTVVLAAAVATSLAGGELVTLPNLTGGIGAAVPVAHLIPAAVGCVIAMSTHSPGADLERLAARDTRPYKAVHVVGLLALSVALLTGAAAVGGAPQLGPSVAWNTFGYAGLALATTPLLGAFGSYLLPLAFTATVPILGLDTAGTPRWWAWPLATANQATAWVWTSALVLVGVAAYVLLPGRTGVGDDPLAG
ncbi:MAG: hypothetical protein ACOYBY_00560 [Dermatophilaceae bacterium]